MAEAGSSERRVAVVVVHGVGNNEPGSTVNYVVRSLRKQAIDQAGQPLTDDQRLHPTDHNEVHLLPEPESAWREAVTQDRMGQDKKEDPDIGDGHGRFPVYARQANNPEGGTSTFYELYWADLARSDASWWSTAKSFARFIFEIPHVIDGFLRDAPDALSQTLRRLLLIATCYVRGPLAGYCAVMLTGGLIFLSFGWIPDREDVAALIGVGPIQHGSILNRLPEVISRPLLGLLAHVPNLNNHTTLVMLPAILLIFFALMTYFIWNRVRLRYAAVFGLFVSAFYLLDIGYLRAWRYPHYEGLVYVDYLSVMLFGLATIGLYIYQTRRQQEVGFADLGIAMSGWSIFFIAHLSVIGDTFRRAVFDNPTIISTKVTTLSSTVQYEAFGLFYPYLAGLWALWGLMMALAFLLAGIVFLFNFWRWGERHRGIFAALALAIVQACVWLTAVPALGVMHMDDVLCRGSRSYASVKQPVSCQTKLETNHQAVDLLLRLNQQIEDTGPTLSPATRDELSRSVRDRFPHTLNLDMLKAMRELALSFVWHGFILVIVVVVGVAVAAYRHFAALAMRKTGRRFPMPRLVISKSILACLLLFGLMNVVLSLSWIETFAPVQAITSGLGFTSLQQIDVSAEVVQMAMITSTVLLLIAQLPQISTPLSSVFQIMRGLIDHHYRVRVSFLPRLLNAPKADEPIRRDHITQRLDRLVSELILGKGYTEILFLTHSQGSIVVYDYLRNNAQRLAIPAHVVTAGSPLGALYAYYFNEYDDLDATLDYLRKGVATWTNLYRMDDPIAGPIMSAEVLRRLRAASPATGSPKNTDGAPPRYQDREMLAGGHTRYWEEPLVCDVVRNLLAGRPPLPPQPDRSQSTAAAAAQSTPV